MSTTTRVEVQGVSFDKQDRVRVVLTGWHYIGRVGNIIIGIRKNTHSWLIEAKVWDREGRSVSCYSMNKDLDRAARDLARDWEVFVAFMGIEGWTFDNQWNWIKPENSESGQ